MSTFPPQGPPAPPAPAAGDIPGRFQITGLPALPPTFWDQWWPHITATAGAFVAIALGAADHWFPVTGPNAWGSNVELLLIGGGLTALGVTLTSAAARTP